MTDVSWTIAELRLALAEFERDLIEARLAASSVKTYVDRPERFLRYLAGDYPPRPR